MKAEIGDLQDDEKRCPLKAGSAVPECAHERCAWWDSADCAPQCVLQSIGDALGHIARRWVEMRREEP